MTASTESNPQSERWAPAIPLDQCHSECVKLAAKLKRAMVEPLARRNDQNLTSDEFEELGVITYAAEFGYALSKRHFRRLLKRTLHRDGGAEDFERLEIYLPDRLKPDSGKTQRRAILEPSDIPNLGPGARPTPTEQIAVWSRACLGFHARLLDGEPERQLREQMLSELLQLPWLKSCNRSAVRVQFQRKYSAWLAGADMIDGRRKRKQRAAPLDQDTVDRAAYHAVSKCGDRVTQSVFELADNDCLDPRFKALIGQSRRWVNKRLRQAVTQQARIISPFLKDRRSIDEATPPLDLSYEGVCSMDAIQADDFTMPVYFAVPADDWYQLTRGQVLLYIDWRTTFILGFCLSPEPQYNSRLIRTGFVRVFDAWGVPDVLYLERGIWEKSKLITGAKGCALNNEEVETGLRQFGVDFIHSKHPQSKPVERTGGLLQDLMEGEPGYCGRDERKDCPERTRKQKLLVESRKSSPQDLGIYDLESWKARLYELCERYNQAPQRGKRLSGLSPGEAFAKLWKENEVTKFGPQHRFLFAHHKVPVTVRADGLIKFTVNGEQYRYCDEQTGLLPGAKLVAWFNVDEPDLCTFTTPDLQQPFNVMRQPKTNGLRYDDNYERAVQQVQSTTKARKAVFHTMKAKFEPTFRNTIAPAAVGELGKTIESGRAAVARQVSLDRRAAEAYGALGMAVPARVTLEQIEMVEGMHSRAQKESL